MKLAVISVTGGGAALAERLQELLAADGLSVDLYRKQGRGSAGQEYDSLPPLISRLFSAYDGLVCIMAAGIVVRAIAPLVQDKRTDPAVVVIDEAARHVISLLSGHLGRANQLTLDLAARLGADPVITTATDVLGKTAPDVLAAAFDLAIEPFERLKPVNSLLAEGQSVDFVVDASLPQAKVYQDWLRQRRVEAVALADWTDRDCAAVLITDKQLAGAASPLYLRPKTLVAGIGCRRGTPAATILAALADACGSVGRSPQAVGTIASVSLKADEAGMLAAAESIKAKTEFYEPAVLERITAEQELTISQFVKEKIGVGSVCEAAAICGAGNPTLLLRKQRYPGITVALAEARSGL
ncbi:MAG: cobalt-precorrin 5A hydrolase [Sporomusaceae bacterium]|nr:cobalt-precorrin 5A hydrolase [Sporomusaceae bacterium]